MKFIDAYKEMMDGKKIAKPDMKFRETQNDIKYFCKVDVKYVIGDDLLKQDAPFVVAYDESGSVQRIDEPSIISLLVSEDQDWSEYVEPEVKVLDIEDAVIEPVE
jgi:hypothetical protein